MAQLRIDAAIGCDVHGQFEVLSHQVEGEAELYFPLRTNCLNLFSVLLFRPVEAFEDVDQNLALDAEPLGDQQRLAGRPQVRRPTRCSC